MWDFFSKVVDKFTDPALLGAIITIGGLFYLLLQKEKNIKSLHEFIATTSTEGSKSLAELITLVEVIVYGRGGNGRAK